MSMHMRIRRPLSVRIRRVRRSRHDRGRRDVDLNVVRRELVPRWILRNRFAV